MRRSVSLFLAFTLLPLAAAAAQGGQSAEPRRPALPADADVNDASAYYEYGAALLKTRPQEAADAFYWASRIDPQWAQPLYARRIALMMSDPNRLVRYMDGVRGVVTSAESRRIDSLQYRALMASPFLHPKFDQNLVELYLRTSAEQWYRRNYPREQVDPMEIEHWIQSYFRTADAEMSGWMAYGEGRFSQALERYAAALRTSRDKAGIHAIRARLFYLTGKPDSAVAEMTQAVAARRAREDDDKKLVFVYDSKALYEHSIGLAHEEAGRLAEAREAYGRALQEDLAYYPAHARLAEVALASGDTATAISELDLAVQIREDEPTLRYSYGKVLTFTGRYDDAAVQLRKAVEIDPYFAAPYALLGGVLETRGDRAAALAQYRAFLEHASRANPLLQNVRARIAALDASPPTGGNP